MDKVIKGKSLMAVLFFAAAMIWGPAALQAQIVGEIEANIPFEFHAESTRLPAGQYFIFPAQEYGTTVLELQNADGKISVFVSTDNTQATQAPKTSELLFDKVGNRHFLRGITVQDSLMGYDIPPSKLEKALTKGSVKIEKHRITVKHNKIKTRTSH